MYRRFQCKAASAKSMTPISNTLTPMVMVRLLKRSARYPPAIENRIKGVEKRRPSNGTMASRCWAELAAFKPINMTSVLRALSLNAP